MRLWIKVMYKTPKSFYTEGEWRNGIITGSRHLLNKDLLSFFSLEWQTLAYIYVLIKILRKVVRLIRYRLNFKILKKARGNENNITYQGTDL